MVRAVPDAPSSLRQRLREAHVPQAGFTWSRERWEPVVAEDPAALNSLEALPARLNREEVRDQVQHHLESRRALCAFLPVMIWGGPGGYGPVRSRAILTGVRGRAAWDAKISSDVLERLLQGADAVRTSGAEEAFRLLNNEGHIKYLGGAFFTKWMSFSSATGDVYGHEVAPILDKRVRDWIYQETKSTSPVNLSTTSTTDYSRYLDVLDAWRSECGSGRSRAQVEQAIFDLTRDRPA